MPYYNVKPHTLYQSCMSSAWEWSGGDDPITRARAWVEAENVYEMWKLVQVWYELIENDGAVNRFPDPLWKSEDYPEKVPLNQEIDDTFIEEMDADFMWEKSRFQERFAPEFSRLPPHARMAFVQDAYKLVKTGAQINSEADERLSAGETLPPPVQPK